MIVLSRSKNAASMSLDGTLRVTTGRDTVARHEDRVAAGGVEPGPDPSRAGRPARGRWLPARGQAPALPDAPPPDRVLQLRRPRDRGPGPRAVAGVLGTGPLPGQAHPRPGLPLPLGVPRRPLPNQARGDPLPLPARVVPLVPAGAPGQEIRRRDRLRPLRVGPLPPPNRHRDTGRRRNGPDRLTSRRMAISSSWPSRCRGVTYWRSSVLTSRSESLCGALRGSACLGSGEGAGSVGEGDRLLEPGEALGGRRVEPAGQGLAAVLLPSIIVGQRVLGHRVVRQLLPSRRSRIASRAATSARSCGRSTPRFILMRSSTEATRTGRPPRSTTSDRPQSSSNGTGSSTKRSTARIGSFGSRIENTRMSFSEIHLARTSASPNPSGSTGADGPRPTPRNAATTFRASRGERSTARSRSAVSLAYPWSTIATPPTTTYRTSASFSAARIGSKMATGRVYRCDLLLR